MKKVLFNVLALGFLLIIVSSSYPVWAAPTFDQGDEHGNWNYPGIVPLTSWQYAQSFQPAQNNIVQVDLYLFPSSSVDYDMYITDIYDGNEPIAGEILYRTTETVSSVGWYSFIFTAISVIIGNTYWIVAHENTGVGKWYYTNDNPYSRGQLYQTPGSDMGFRTFYDPALPEFENLTLTGLFMLGMVAGVWVVRTKKRIHIAQN